MGSCSVVNGKFICWLIWSLNQRLQRGVSWSEEEVKPEHSVTIMRLFTESVRGLVTRSRRRAVRWNGVSVEERTVATCLWSLKYMLIRLEYYLVYALLPWRVTTIYQVVTCLGIFRHCDALQFLPFRNPCLSLYLKCTSLLWKSRQNRLNTGRSCIRAMLYVLKCCKYTLNTGAKNWFLIPTRTVRS